MKSHFIKKSLSLFLFLICLSLAYSCGNKKSIEEAQKVINESTPQALLRELEKVTKDNNALSRMLEITPSVISRILDGSTQPTESLQKRIQKVYQHYYCSGSILDTRATFDPKSKSFFKRMWLWPKYYTLWFIISIIIDIGIIIICFASDEDLGRFIGVLFIVEFIIKIILFIFLNSSSVRDPYTDKLDESNEFSVSDNLTSADRATNFLFNITETQKTA